MTKIKEQPFTKETFEDARTIDITYKIAGFWNRAVRVLQRMDFCTHCWREPEILRTLGGQDETIPHIQSEENFLAALRDAIVEAKRLHRRTGTKVNQ